jgi:hypothetical protein
MNFCSGRRPSLSGGLLRPLCRPFPPFGRRPDSAQLRRPRAQSATSTSRRLRPYCGCRPSSGVALSRRSRSPTAPRRARSAIDARPCTRGCVWREIFVDNGPNDSVGGVHDFWRREQAYPVCQRIYSDHSGYIVAPILQIIGIQFGGLVQKPAKQGRSALPLGSKTLGPRLRVLPCRRGRKRAQAADSGPGDRCARRYICRLHLTSRICEQSGAPHHLR